MTSQELLREQIEDRLLETRGQECVLVNGSNYASIGFDIPAGQFSVLMGDGPTRFRGRLQPLADILHREGFRVVETLDAPIMAWLARLP